MGLIAGSNTDPPALGISHQVEFMTEASDKDCNYQRTTCQTKFQWCRHTGECDRKTTQKDTQENTYENTRHYRIHR